MAWDDITKVQHIIWKQNSRQRDKMYRVLKYYSLNSYRKITLYSMMSVRSQNRITTKTLNLILWIKTTQHHLLSNWVLIVFLCTYLPCLWHFWVVSCNSLHASRLTATEFPSTNTSSPSMCKKSFIKKMGGNKSEHSRR